MMETYSPCARTRRQFLQLSLATGVSAVAVSGCAFQGSDSKTAKSSDAKGSPAQTVEGGTLKLTTGFAIKNLIPAKSGFWGPEFAFAELLLRPQRDSNPTDWILSKAEAADDLTWKLELKPGVHFQNGKALDAQELAKLMNYHIANTANVTSILKGATVTADSGTVLTLKTVKPVPQIPNILCDEAYFCIFDVDAYKATNDDPAKLIEAKIYTGPYVPEKLDDSALISKADPNYWGGKLPLDGIEVKFVADEGARIKAVQNGEVDLALYPPTQAYETLKNAPDVSFNLGEATGPTFCFFMNQTRPVFKDPKIRRGLLMLFDYKAIAQDVMHGLYDPVSSFYDPKLPYAIDIWKTDPEQAAKLFQEAGAKKEDGVWKLASGEPFRFEILTYPQQPDSDAIALALQAQLKEHGVQVAIKQVPDISAAFTEGTFDAGLSANGTLSFGGSPIAPLINGYKTGSKRNFSKISDPELDKLIDQVAVTVDKDKAYDLLKQIQTRIGEQGHNGYTGRRRSGVVAGKRMKSYVVPHALLWVGAQTRLESR